MKPDIIMATLAGSHLYGTNTPYSDIDIRGVCFAPEKSLLGLTKFEQYNPSTQEALMYSSKSFDIESDDVVIYGLPKFFNLCLGSNPNIIEMLFATNPIYECEIWRKIVLCRHLFLSKLVTKTFSGYALSQLKKIKNHKRWLDNPPIKPNLFGIASYPNYPKIGFEKRNREYQNYTTWQKNRNPARAKLESEYGFDTKHAAHLYRLFFEAEELLSSGKITFPLKDDVRKKVLNVLNGGVSYDEVIATAETIKDRLMSIPTQLPNKPNFNDAERLLQNIQIENILKIDIALKEEIH